MASKSRRGLRGTPTSANGSVASDGPDAPIEWHRPEVLKEQLLEAGLDLLDRDGLAYHLRNLTYAQVFAHLEAERGIRVTRASVHERIWENQDAFRLDAVLALNDHHKRQQHYGIEELLTLVDEFESRPLGPNRINEFFGRWDQLSLHLVANHDHTASLVLRALSLVGDSEQRELLSRAAQIRTPSGLAQLRWLYRRILRMLGYQAKRDLGLTDDQAIRLFAMMGTSVSTGLTLNNVVGVVDGQRTVTIRGPNGEETPLTLMGVALRACFALLFEPSPDGQRLSVDPPPEFATAPPPPRADPESTKSRSGRRSRAELKRLVLDAAVDLLDRDGLCLNAESIGYQATFDRIEEKYGVIIHRSSVHRRLWDSNDEFRYDVLAAALDSLPSYGFTAGFSQADIVIDDDGMVDLRQRVQDTIRLSVEAWNGDKVNHSTMSRWIKLKAATLDPDPDGRRIELRRQIADRCELIIDSYAETYAEPMRRAKIDASPDIDLSWDEAFRLQAIMMYSAGVGFSLDHEAGNNDLNHTFLIRRCDGSGHSDEWTAFGLTTLAINEFLFDCRPRPAAEIDFAINTGDRSTTSS